MVFSGIPFLFYFLPAMLLIYFLAPSKAKNAVILIFSLIFYAWGEPKFVLAMVFDILAGYILGLLMEKTEKKSMKTLYLFLSLGITLGLLGYCKYMDFFIDTFNHITGMSAPLMGIALPVGISFYTFQILSYVIDVYRGDVKAQRNLINLAAYIAMFPQLIAGPIVRYSDIAEQLEHRTHSIEKASLGIRRFVIGLSKKVFIANTLGELVAAFKDTQDGSTLYFWIYAVAYTLHIYFDFSGYSDMAIGLGKIMGFDFVENFNYPYISASITEFWRRWHMSLGSWFRDYVYIPLGGNRCSTGRWLLNILIVWFLTGMWHGAAWNFIVWGLLYGVLLVIEKLWLLKGLKKTRVISHIYVMLFVIIGFVFFDAASLGEAVKVIIGMFGGLGLPAVSAEALYYLRSYAVIFIMAIIGATPLMKKLIDSAAEKSEVCKKVLQAVEPLFLLLCMAAATGYLVDGSFNPFLYFRF